MVPEGWSNTVVDDCISFHGGTQPPKSVFESEPGPGLVRLIQTRDFKTDKFATYIPEALAKNSFVETDIMIGRYGPPVFQIYRGKSGAYNVALIKAVPKDGIDPDYAYYFLKGEHLYRQIDSLSRRSAGQAGVEMDFLKNYPMPTPPPSEQRRIADILSTWDAAIEKTEALLAAAKAQKRALMQSLLTGRRRFPQFEGQPWKEVRLGDLFFERSDKGGSDLPLLAITGSRGVIPQSETDRRDTSREDKSSYKQIHVGDIGYNSMRMWQGVSALSSMDGLISPAYTVVIPGPEIDARFAAQLFKLPRQVHYFRRYSQGLTSDTWNLKFKQFVEVPTLIPSVTEQIKIAEMLDASDGEIAQLDGHVSKLRTEKKALMQQLLTGKRRVVV